MPIKLSAFPGSKISIPNISSNSKIKLSAFPLKPTPIVTKQPILPGPRILEVEKPSYKLTGDTVFRSAPEKVWPLGFVGRMAKTAYETTKEAFTNVVDKAVEVVNLAGKYKLSDYKKISSEYGKSIGEPGGAITEEEAARRAGVKPVTPLKRAVSYGQLAVGAANLYFLPITTQLAAAEKLPGPLSIPAKGVNFLFNKLGEAGAWVIGQDIQSLVDGKTISKETADEITPLAGELAAFVTQYLGVKAAHSLSTKGLGKFESKIPFSEVTKARLSYAVKLATGLSVTPFTTTYGLVSGKIAEKIHTRKQSGIEITPSEGVKIINEVKQEMPQEMDAFLPPEIPKPEIKLTPLKIEVKPSEPLIPSIEKIKQSEIPVEIKVDKLESRVFKRLKEDHEQLTGELLYEPIKLKEETRKAIDLITSDKQKAFDIAMGKYSPDVTSTSVNIALSEKALEEGNNSLYSRLVKNRSLTQTRRGQEIVSEKGSVTDNSTSRYVKELVAAKLEKLGRSYLADLVGKIRKQSPKQKAIKIIDREVVKAKENISKKKLDIKEAQALLDKLICK